MCISKPPRLLLVIGAANSEYALLLSFAGGLTNDLPSAAFSLCDVSPINCRSDRIQHDLLGQRLKILVAFEGRVVGVHRRVRHFNSAEQSRSRVSSERSGFHIRTSLLLFNLAALDGLEVKAEYLRCCVV